jgi:hypothetical protein
MQTMTSKRVFFTLLFSSLLLTACWPGPITDGGEISSDSGTDTGETDGPGDGDGDPGDGDGDLCDPPTVTCSESGECWASDLTWTAEASATLVNAVIEPGIWVPVNLGLDAECWELNGVGTHVCIVDVCGVHLLGYPAGEMTLAPDPECDFIGAWSATATGQGKCYGLIAGVAVELRGTDIACIDAPHRELAEVLCTADGCEGRWQESELWSRVAPADEILALPMTDPATVWPCQPAPPVDGCFQIDDGGHVACVWIMNGWAVPVAPCCAIDGFGWLPIGDGMAAFGSTP